MASATNGVTIGRFAAALSAIEGCAEVIQAPGLAAGVDAQRGWQFAAMMQVPVALQVAMVVPYDVIVMQLPVNAMEPTSVSPATEPAVVAPTGWLHVNGIEGSKTNR
ncbi:hypothetical protein [Rhodoferax sp.]|uniref:hypothetical protein n=1 Tax=Rhodoferax sp. TaxID=50421 RepID=UPI0027558B9B|nr:hypothetical protein [Rhodoferax sp.]